MVDDAAQRRRRARRGPARVPRPVDDPRLLPQARGHRRHHAARRVARQRRPRVPRGRRDLRLRTPQGPDHQGRPQPGAAGDRGGGGLGRGRAARLRRGLRRAERVARHRGAGGGGRDARQATPSSARGSRPPSPSAWPRRSRSRPTGSCWWLPARCPRPRAARCGAPPLASSSSPGRSAKRSARRSRRSCGSARAAAAEWAAAARAPGRPRALRGSGSPLAAAGAAASGVGARGARAEPALRLRARARSRHAPLLRLCGCRLEATGLERLPRRGPLVLACNHASYVDVAALLALLPIDVLFVAKREILSYPVIGTFVRRCGHPTVDRWDALQSVADADQVARALAAGQQRAVLPGRHLRRRDRAQAVPARRLHGRGARRRADRAARPARDAPRAARRSAAAAAGCDLALGRRPDRAARRRAARARRASRPGRRRDRRRVRRAAARPGGGRARREPAGA